MGPSEVSVPGRRQRCEVRACQRHCSGHVAAARTLPTAHSASRAHPHCLAADRSLGTLSPNLGLLSPTVGCRLVKWMSLKHSTQNVPGTSLMLWDRRQCTGRHLGTASQTLQPPSPVPRGAGLPPPCPLLGRTGRNPFVPRQQVRRVAPGRPHWC